MRLSAAVGSAYDDIMTALTTSPLAARDPLILANGERMSRAEFHRLYEDAPENLRAELIGGVVYMASPLRRSHGTHHVFLSALFGQYMMHTPGVEAGDNASLLLGEDSEPQPDLYLRILPEYGGQSTTTPDDYVDGAPELVLEISLSSRSLDLHRKREDYQKYGVREYLVWVPPLGTMYWFDLAGSVEHLPQTAGVIQSREFPGLWLDVAALASQQHQTALTTLQAGLASPEHAEFVRLLAARRQPSP
jgi:Uma2 family endonuclease